MSEESRTVRVSGMPGDMEEERLIDKLAVHFLRPSNGGGEIESVTMETTEPYGALIQFEDSGVARRVIGHGRHTLKVDGEDYKLSVSEHCPSPDPNQLITSLTATVDYSQFPGGERALVGVLQDHPHVEASFDSAHKSCRLRGSYTQARTLLARLLGRRSQDERWLAGLASQSGSESPGERAEVKDPPGGSSTETAEDKDPPGGSSTETAEEKDVQSGSPIPEEDPSLMLDADVFRYLQKRYGQEYRRLQSLHGVRVVDATARGVTALFLRAVGREGGGEPRRLELARMAIRDLCQESERRICQAKIPKGDLDPGCDLRRATDTLRLAFPDLLLDQDGGCVFLIGDCCDVSEAKCFLLREHGAGGGERRENAARQLGGPSPRPARGPAAPRCPATPGDREDPARPSAKARGSEGGRVDRLDAGSGDPEPPLPSSAVDLYSCGASSEPNRPLDAAEDGLSVTRRRTSVDAPAERTVRGTAPLRPPVKAHTRSDARNAESFSGATRKSADDWSASLPGAGTPRPEEPVRGEPPRVYRVEVLVSTVMWLHIKEVHGARVEALTRYVELTEAGRRDGIRSAVGLSGSDRAAVSACRLSLLELVEGVGADFSVRELHLAELDVHDVEDVTWRAACAEVRRRVAKISLRVKGGTLYLLGPRRLCRQVSASLREVFCGDRWQGGGRRAGPGPAARERPRKRTLDRAGTEPVGGAVSGSHLLVRETLEWAGRRNRGSVVVHAGFGSPSTRRRFTTSPPEEGLSGAVGTCGQTAPSGHWGELEVLAPAEGPDAVRARREGPRPPRSAAGVSSTANGCKVNLSLPGHKNRATIKVTYRLPDDVQEGAHPSPGRPFRGGVLKAFFPDGDKSGRLVPRLEDAFRRGLTFTPSGREKGSGVVPADRGGRPIFPIPDARRES